MHSVLYGKFSVQSKKTHFGFKPPSPQYHSYCESTHHGICTVSTVYKMVIGEKNFIWNNIDAETLFAFSMLCGRLAFHLRGMYNTVFLSRNTPIIEESLK